MMALPPGLRIPPEWDQVLARYYVLGGSAVASMEELMGYLTADEHTVELAESRNRNIFVSWLRREEDEEVGMHSRLSVPFCHSLHADPRFKALVVDRLQINVIGPAQWYRIYSTIGQQLADPTQPLGQKSGVLQTMLSQQGLLRPKKVDINQQVSHQGAIIFDLGGGKILPIPGEVVEGEYAALPSGVEPLGDLADGGEMGDLPLGVVRGGGEDG